jgi:hypothetical protein
MLVVDGTERLGSEEKLQLHACPAAIFFVLPDEFARLDRDDFSSNRHPDLAFWWSMIFFRKPVPTFRDHALNAALARATWPVPGR